MNLDRRLFLAGSAAAFLPRVALGEGGAPKEAPVRPVLMDDGRYTQPWFYTSFLILKDDLADSAAQGKRLALLWDQRGCPYCKEMHEVNLADPAVNRYIRERFNVVQLDLNGLRDVTDFDGEVLPEKALARKYGVIGTPTIQFLPPDVAGVEGKSGRAVEVTRMPGYLRPGMFEGMFAFVYDRAYEKENFRRYMEERAGKSGPAKSG